jgi:hypothetical protein
VSVTDRSVAVRPAPVRSTAAGIRYPVIVFAVWRALHGLVVVVSGGSLQKAGSSWDGTWYLYLLRHGYTVSPAGYGKESDAAFFPGLSWVTHAVQLVLPEEAAATLVVSNGLALAAFVAVWGAVRSWVDEPVARRATVALALFPTSFFLWTYYTEGLLLAATAGAVWAGRRERHTLAAVLLAAASSARTVGVLVGPALAVARIVRLRRVDSVSVRYVAGSAVGLAAVMTQQAVQIGDPFGWLRAGAAWHRELAGPWMPLLHAVHLLVVPRPGIAVDGVLLDVLGMVGVGALLVLLWRGARRGAWPLEAPALTTPLWLLPICSTLSVSQARYMLACWPALLVVADAWPRLPRPVRIAALVLPALASAVLIHRLAQGGFAG